MPTKAQRLDKRLQILKATDVLIGMVHIIHNLKGHMCRRQNKVQWFTMPSRITRE